MKPFRFILAPAGRSAKAVAFCLFVATVLASHSTAASPADRARDAAGSTDSQKDGGIETYLPPGNDYKLDAGDRLRVRFFDRYDRDDLNGEYVVNESGQLRLPRIGEFVARGTTTDKLEADIRQAAEKRGEKLGYFSVEVSRCRPFYVTGVAGRPGAYPYVPGMTVLHAVSLAGGLYRPAPSMLVDALREKRTMSEMEDRLAILLARRARLLSEREDETQIATPPELSRLKPSQDSAMIQTEQSLLRKTTEVFIREKSGLESSIALHKGEIAAYKAEILRIDDRIEDSKKIVADLKRLHEQRIINQQRYIEVLTSLDNSQRDRQATVTALNIASAALEKAERELSLLTLSRSARIANELAETEQEISRLKSSSEDARRLISTLNQQSLGGQVSFRILRKDETGKIKVFRAQETTPVVPGDVIEVENTAAEPDPIN